MRFVVTGPHCSGKTTLLKRVKLEVENLTVKFSSFDGSSCPIDYSNKKILSDRNNEIAISLWMTSKLLIREIEVSCNLNNKKEIVIFDRCLLDQIVYPLVNQVGEITAVVKKYINLWLNKNPYDLIFYVPKNEFFLKKVPAFNQDIDYLNDVEKTYLEVLSQLKNVIFLPQNQDEQKDIIVSTIKTSLSRCGELHV